MPAKKAPKAKKSRIVTATGTAASAKDRGLALAIEQAMAQAVEKAAADGVTDPNDIRARMLAARDAVKQG